MIAPTSRGGWPYSCIGTELIEMGGPNQGFLASGASYTNRSADHWQSATPGELV